MAKNIHSEVLEQVEDYKISDIVIRNAVGERLNIPVGVITELNIFEDNENSILFIEWPQIIEKKPKSIIKILFEYENNYTNRFITVLN